MKVKLFDILTNLLGSPIENISQHFYDSYVEKNIKIRSKAGLKATIVRRQVGKCCKWCANLAGTYNADDAPDNIYQRHENCRCMVTYKSEKGGYTDVWSKKQYSTQREARKARESEIAQSQEGVADVIERLKNAKDASKQDLRAKILNGDYSLKLKHQKYLQHKEGTVQYQNSTDARKKEQSYLTITETETQRIIYDYTGKGKIQISKNGDFLPKEYVDTSMEIGYYYEKGEWHKTNRIMIIYARKGSHIVPVKKK